MSRAFDTVNIHKLIHKIHNTNILITVIKYIANYIKGRNNSTQYSRTSSKHRYMETGYLKEASTLQHFFNICTSDIPTPPQLITNADDVMDFGPNFPNGGHVRCRRLANDCLSRQPRARMKVWSAICAG